MSIFVFALVGYFIGSIPTALIVSKRRKIDIRKHGSGNIGGTNTFRVLGKKAGFFVSITDIIKGAVPVLLAGYFAGEVEAAVAGAFASIGHSYSVYVGFKGGKSVATSAGAMLVLSPLAVLIGLTVFAIVLLVKKYVSLASMLAAVTVVLYILIFEDLLTVKLATLFFASFIILRHHSNIKRLAKGVENKAFQKKK